MVVSTFISIWGVTTPPQIVYAPNPVSLITNADILNYLNTYKPLSMVVVDGNAVMLPFGLNDQVQSNYSAQYLDYALFNLITTSNYPF